MAGDRYGRCKPLDSAWTLRAAGSFPAGRGRRRWRGARAAGYWRAAETRAELPPLGFQVEPRLLTKIRFRFLAPTASSNFPPWGSRRSRHNIRKRENSGRVQRCGETDNRSQHPDPLGAPLAAQFYWIAYWLLREDSS